MTGSSAQRRVLGWVFGLAVVLLAGSWAGAKVQRGQVTQAAVSTSALPAGDKGVLAVEVEVKDGFHAQSHAPLDPLLVKFVLRLDETPGITFGQIEYPQAEIVNSPTLGKLSVYTGRFVVRVPFEVAKDAKPGPVQIKGSLHYQVCDDNVCYPPESPPFKVETEVAPAGTEVKKNDSPLFRESRDKPADTQPAATQASAGGATPPGATPASGPPIEVGGKQTTAGVQFLTAFLVGIIFNVVPCVLPVLPLKAVGFYEASQHDRLKSVSFGLAFSLGLVATFALFGILLFGYSWIGFHDRPFDWGQLFTKPWFTGGIVLILVGMAAQTFGAFSVGIPTALYSVSPRHDTYWGNFLFGILTALLSTPCTFGMFVGLLAWAITQPPAVGVLILVTVGAGMAFPYLALSAMPEVARRFPRTGPWAEVVKQMMGFLLLLAAVYFARPFLGRIAAFHGERFWWLTFAVVVGAAVYLTVRTFEYARSAAGKIVGVAIALVLVVGSLGAVRNLTATPYQWQPFTPAALDTARSKQVVLVEFTADWCGNCQYVEAHVLHNNDVIRAVRNGNVTMLKADVTRDDAPARPLLETLNPAGSIPLTVIYSPRLARPIELSGIYSRQDLIKAIETAAGS